MRLEIGSRLTTLLACYATTGIKAIGLVLLGAMAEDGKTRIEKFDCSNFAFWKMQMEDYLYQKDLYIPLRRKREETRKDDR